MKRARHRAILVEHFALCNRKKKKDKRKEGKENINSKRLRKIISERKEIRLIGSRAEGKLRYFSKTI